MKSHLRVKIKSLAAEADIIRKEEARAKRSAAWNRGHQQEEPAAAFTHELFGLHHHRTHVVRKEARAAQCAYAILRDRPYAATEPGAKTYPDMDKVAGMLVRFGGMRAHQARDVAAVWVGRTPLYGVRENPAGG